MILPVLDQNLALLLAAVAVAGVARGLSGFGTGMIVTPIAAALYDPITAVVLIVIIDSLPMLPVTIPVLKIARWREVLPILAGLGVFVPVGIYILKHGDPALLRWFICLTILVCVLALWRGWRYRGPRSLPISFSVGGLAGVLSGIASLPGPPVIVYWLATALPAAIVRANLLALFFLSEFLSIGNLWAAGLFEMPRLMLGLTATPFYLTGLLLGWGLYGRSSEQVYRRFTFALVVAAALIAMPTSEYVVRAAISALAA
ncbi:sulfite exporter TauE/SafE family protein [Chelativorans salis]|uniref:Probable membrane transporter protein n=1 Tax=Chelativorans salis TaxID=2978478 RepID=A0ABT2LRX0_9HYPH|nr:sulfite exporter TauE/SafE family protein [Chelativorans sp. EGI FJ00035]MCT7377276.1 sulfite exporter TauE/SafE family protein [Chelativorans sp. EGI FJ00035]